MVDHLYRIITLVVVVSCLDGCGLSSLQQNLGPALLQQTPSISTYQDPAADIADYETFSVFPASLVSKELDVNEILEKQMLFFLRNLIEGRGYRFVELNQNPDLLVTLMADSVYNETYVPPQTVTVPRWVPGRTITSYTNQSGSFNYNTYGSYSSYGWGSYSGASSTSTHLPGYMTTDTYTRSGYNVGYHYPTVTVMAFDAKSSKNIWMGTGAGTSKNPDVRVSSQLVLAGMINKIPSPSKRLIDFEGNGLIGVDVTILTADGNRYLPTVTQFAKGGGARQAGMRLYDMILSIDGKSMVNRPIREVADSFFGEVGSEARIEVLRGDQTVPVSLARIQRRDIDFP